LLDSLFTSNGVKSLGRCYIVWRDLTPLEVNKLSTNYITSSKGLNSI
jgi:hypothetical protein